MTFEITDVNRAIARAMGEQESPPEDYLSGDHATDRFFEWAEGRLTPELRDLVESLVPFYGKPLALISALRIMDGFFGVPTTQSTNRRQARMESELDLKSLVTEADRTLLVAGLQALHRERVAAWNAAVSVAIIRGEKQPAMELFGIDEVATMLRRVGAAPSSF